MYYEMIMIRDGDQERTDTPVMAGLRSFVNSFFSLNEQKEFYSPSQASDCIFFELRSSMRKEGGVVGSSGRRGISFQSFISLSITEDRILKHPFTRMPSAVDCPDAILPAEVRKAVCVVLFKNLAAYYAMVCYHHTSGHALSISLLAS